jgi:hypothetical protein
VTPGGVPRSILNLSGLGSSGKKRVDGEIARHLLRPGSLFAANIQPIRERLVSRVICPPNIGQQPAALADQFEQTSPGGIVLLMLAKMICQRFDAVGQYGDLDFWRSSIPGMARKLLDQCLLGFFIHAHDVCNSIIMQ